MSIVFNITDQIFLGYLGIVSFHNKGKYGITFSENMQPVVYICKEVKRR